MKSEILFKILGFIAGLAVIAILFVSAFEIGCYSDYGFYQKEYTKYQVNNRESILNMTTEELMKVTKQMMSYLHGNREDLVVYAQIDGKEKMVFNEIDQSHMADVRTLFLTGLEKRWICVGIFAVSTALLLLLCGRKKGLAFLCSGIQTAICLELIFTAIIVCAAIYNFTAVFYMMHYLLFDNMNWILDPSISRLINMLPEGFFVDIAVRIAVIFLFLNFFIFILSFLIKRGMIGTSIDKGESNKNISGGTYEQG